MWFWNLLGNVIGYSLLAGLIVTCLYGSYELFKMLYVYLNSRWPRKTKAWCFLMIIIFIFSCFYYMYNNSYCLENVGCSFCFHF